MKHGPRLRITRRLLRRVLPYPLHVFLIKPRPDLATRARVRRDVVRLEISGGAFLELYWKEVELGCGPAVILNVCAREVLRFDCFGHPGGHYHAQVMGWRRRGASRLQLPETTRESQIERALFELRTNYRWYLDHHPLYRIRHARIDGERMSEATEQARCILLSYARKCALRPSTLPPPGARDASPATMPSAHRAD